MTTTDLSTQLYQVFIKATPEQIWEAITKPEYSVQYFHGSAVEARPERYLSHGPDGARLLADEAAERAHARLGEVPADTSVLAEIVAGLAARTS